MSGRIIRLELPMPPRFNSNTHRSHWTRAYAAKKRYYKDCDARQQLGIIPPPPETPLSRVIVNATMYVSRMSDHDNAFFRASKFPMDWLKTRGYIVDDSPKVVQWAGLPRQITRRGNPLSIVFTLTELAVLPALLQFELGGVGKREVG